MNTATLSAEINPNFADTTYYFEYVQAAQYNPVVGDPYGGGTRVPAGPGVDIGSEYGDQGVTAALTGLIPATMYRFRVVAVNAEGTTYGPDRGSRRFTG